MEILISLKKPFFSGLAEKLSSIIKTNMQNFYQKRWFKIGLPVLVVLALVAGAAWYTSDSEFFQGYLRRAAPVPEPSEPISRLPDPTLAECKQYKQWFAKCEGTCKMDGDISHAVRCEEVFESYWHKWPSEDECANLNPASADAADIAYCQAQCVGTPNEKVIDAQCAEGTKTVAEAEPADETATASLEITEPSTEEPSTEQLYSDVPASHPQYAYIMYVSEELKAFSGYPDGSFKPTVQINRAEFMKVVSLWLKLTPVDGASQFSDVENGSWYEPYVNAAVAAGIVSGYEDGSFGPANGMTQAELMKIVVNGSIFADMVDENYGAEWYEKYYKVAVDNGLFNEANKAPLDPATRGLAAELIYKADKSV